MAVPTKAEETLTVKASPEDVYALVSDVTRMGQWSPECCRCEWLDGADGPAIGARFRGTNRMGPFRWSTTCTVAAATPGQEFTFTHEAARWSYRFQAGPAGTAVTESYEILAPRLIKMGSIVALRHRQLRRGMRRTLAKLKVAAEASATE